MDYLKYLPNFAQDGAIIAWDLLLTAQNTISGKRKVGQVTPAGHPGFEGKWPAYVPPQAGDSRCSCPALNAMANHGILPHDGKNITFKELGDKVHTTYNFAPSFCVFVPNFAARMLERDYSTGKFDLKDLDLHSEKGIEHDASLVRRDAKYEPDQSVICMPYVEELIASATGKDADGNPLLTIPDLSKVASKRRAESRAENPDFLFNKSHQFFGSANASTLLTIFGGRIKDIEAILTEERIPEGWESRIREPQGLTISTFNKTVKQVEGGIDEKPFAPAAKDAAAPAPAQAAASS